MKNIEFNWIRVKNDVNGNPRYVLHFLQCLPQSVKDDSSLWVSEKYQIAIKLMNRLGGRKFHNKQYGGGIVFQSYNLKDTETAILSLIQD